MAISRMLKMQLLGHASVKNEVKRCLREAGVVEVTDVSAGEREGGRAEESAREVQRLFELIDAVLAFLDQYTEKQSLLARLSRGPIRISREEVENLAREVPVEEISHRAVELQNTIRASRDEIARTLEMRRSLEPWLGLRVPLEELATVSCELQLWSVPEKSAGEVLDAVRGRFPLTHVEECSRSGSRVHTCVICLRDEAPAIGEALKESGCVRGAFGDARGTPAELYADAGELLGELERKMEDARTGAEALLPDREKLLVLSDYYRERIGLHGVERHFHRTESTFLLEGWIRAVDRRTIERELGSRFEDIALSFRLPHDDEQPPIHLANRPINRPYEFVTTLYGRPVYGEVDPTPLLAPFFIVFFALCLTDAGYGLALSAFSAVCIRKFRPAGGLSKLLRLLFMGGIVTAAVGIVTGGIFGIDATALPAFMQNFVFINPLEEPMKMLNIAFLMGLVHILFGMGIRMAANLRSGLVLDALLDDCLWILFLIALAPLGFSAILGGEVPPAALSIGTRASLVIAGLIFVTGGRKKKGLIRKLLGGLLGFYDVVGYFGDVLSYARLLALGLATSAIALAVNGIAGMVKGLPFYTGYIVAVLVLVAGHGFNLAVNTLGAFVHSGRLQYLEFFSKFFTGGGKEFRPFRSERRYSVLRDSSE
jgi:V/A-type H+-transporting ATPase subunit I